MAPLLTVWTTAQALGRSNGEGLWGTFDRVLEVLVLWKPVRPETGQCLAMRPWLGGRTFFQNSGIRNKSAEIATATATQPETIGPVVYAVQAIMPNTVAPPVAAARSP
jgi:hypothetical protein